jgi:hypothetical protein
MLPQRTSRSTKAPKSLDRLQRLHLLAPQGGGRMDGQFLFEDGRGVRSISWQDSRQDLRPAIGDQGAERGLPRRDEAVPIPLRARAGLVWIEA